MFSRFFIDRPVFASVIAIAMVAVGAVAAFSLPVSQYPQIVPPVVRVTTSYPGAGAEEVSDTVAQPIEEEVNGVEGMLYMEGTCDNNGTYTLEVTFEVGTDVDIATVQVQNRVASAQARLPEAVTRQGIVTRKRSPNFVQLVSLVSPDASRDAAFLQNYAIIRVIDEISRLEGVGDVDLLGGRDYSMRVWLDPDALRSRNLTAEDVRVALRSQNRQAAAGQVGRPPAPDGQDLQLVVTARGRLDTAEQFEDVVVSRDPAGRIVRVKDVGRVELGVQSYDVEPALNAEASAFIIVYQLPGANALDVAGLVHDKLEELKGSFPAGVDYEVPYDATEFVSLAIEEVVFTLLLSTLIVAVTIFVFLQDWRTTLIPMITIPVALIGTFAVIAALGLGINTITLLAMVLAIGIVVDDAIVVVENVARHVQEDGGSVRDATVAAMAEVTGPVVATSLVLLAVFTPTLFLGGISGGLFLQFGVVLAVSTALSAFNALTLTPALCVLLMKPAPASEEQQEEGPEEREAAGGGGFFVFRWFNRGFDRLTRGYVGFVRFSVGAVLVTLLGYAAVLGVSAWGYTRLPTGFVPEEDQGYAIMVAQLPDGASGARTQAAADRIAEAVLEVPGVRAINSIPGFDFVSGAQVPNFASFFLIFEDWDRRRPQGPIVDEVDAVVGQMKELEAFTVLPPAIRGLGDSGGFTIEILDQADAGLERLQSSADAVASAAAGEASIAQARSTFRASTPQLFADVDDTKAETLGVRLEEVYGALQAQLGSVYVNDFNLFGRVFQVRMQAEGDARDDPEDIGRLQVRGAGGAMIPLATLVDVEDALGPQIVRRFNLYPAAQITGDPAEGFSSGAALDALERVAGQSLPASIGYAWSGSSFQEKAAGGQAPYLLALAVFFVFLVLAAQYESWSLPLGVILAVPGGLVGAVAAVWIGGTDINVYTQIGLVLLVGLASKNAILIVEFAAELRAQGCSAKEAAIEAARVRFRPILMTSLAFVLGVFPLVISTGAGSGARRAIGAAVFGGEITAILLIVAVVPALYVLLSRGGKPQEARDEGGADEDDQHPEETPA